MARREPTEPIRNRAYLRRLGDQRVSTADRDAVIETLSRHCTEGRLTMDEFEERVTAAGAAKTGNELLETLRELPEGAEAGAGPAAFGPSEDDDERWYERLGFVRAHPDEEPMWPHHRPRPWWVLALAAIVLVAIFGGHPGILFPVFWITLGVWFLHRRRWRYRHLGYGCGRHGWAGPPPPWARRWDRRDRDEAIDV